jgi:hypothetical protein
MRRGNADQSRAHDLVHYAEHISRPTRSYGASALGRRSALRPSNRHGSARRSRRLTHRLGNHFSISRCSRITTASRSPRSAVSTPRPCSTR